MYKLLVFILHITNYQVLIAGKTEVGFACLGNLKESSLEQQIIFVQDTAIFYKSSVIPIALMVLFPAIIITAVLEAEWLSWQKRKTNAFFHFFFKDIHAHTVHSIFQT